MGATNTRHLQFPLSAGDDARGSGLQEDRGAGPDTSSPAPRPTHRRGRQRMSDKRFYALLIWSVFMAIVVMGTVIALLQPEGAQ